MTGIDFTPYICVALAILIVAIAVWQIGKSPEFLLTPEPETVRPPREEPIDLAEALRPIGGPPSWDEVRHD